MSGMFSSSLTRMIRIVFLLLSISVQANNNSKFSVCLFPGSHYCEFFVSITLAKFCVLKWYMI